MLRDFLLRLLFNGIGLWIAAGLVAGISYGNELTVLAVAALLFSIVNAVLRPVLIVLSLPAIVLTLGLFTLLINGLMLYLVTIIYPQFEIMNFTSALLAVIIVWIVNHALNTIVSEG